MRKVRNTFNNTNPAVMFAQGVEQIISDKMAHPTNYHDYELNAIARKEQCTNAKSPALTPKRGFHVVDLLKELTWTKREANS